MVVCAVGAAIGGAALEVGGTAKEIGIGAGAATGGGAVIGAEVAIDAIAMP